MIGLVVLGMIIGTTHATFFGDDGLGRWLSGAFCLVFGMLSCTMVGRWFHLIAALLTAPSWRTLGAVLGLGVAVLIVETPPTWSTFCGIRSIQESMNKSAVETGASKEAEASTVSALTAEKQTLRATTPSYLAEAQAEGRRLRSELAALAAETAQLNQDGDKRNDHLIPGLLAQAESLKSDLANLDTRVISLDQRWQKEIDALQDRIDEARQHEHEKIVAGAVAETHPLTALGQDVASLTGTKAEHAVLAFTILLTLLLQFGPHAANFLIVLTPETSEPPWKSVPAPQSSPKPKAGIPHDLQLRLARMNVPGLRVLASQLRSAGGIPHNVLSSKEIYRAGKDQILRAIEENWSTCQPVWEKVSRLKAVDEKAA
jgi:hypothetical protein